MTLSVPWRSKPPALDEAADPQGWAGAAEAWLDSRHPASTPAYDARVRARVLWSDVGLHVSFAVLGDRAIRCVARQVNDPVCQDSCVELFVQPRSDRPDYFNLEVNAGGIPLLYHARQAPVPGTQLTDYEPVTAERMESLGLSIFHHLPRQIEPEWPGPLDWRLGMTFPWRLMEHYIGPLGIGAGRAIRANFYKCGDRTSLPHWLSWSPVGQVLSFHQPDRFGRLVLLPPRAS